MAQKQPGFLDGLVLYRLVRRGAFYGQSLSTVILDLGVFTGVENNRALRKK